MQGATRWWEFYFVRYAVGTLVGALIVNQCIRIDAGLREILLFGLDQGDPRLPTAALLLAYGLLFCYIASVPILVLHAARFAAKAGPRRRANPKSVFAEAKWAIGVALSAVIVLLIAGGYLKLVKQSGNADFVIKLVMTAVLLTLAIEWIAAIFLFACFDNVYEGTRRLARARHHHQNRGGLIDSYRHLREHGNSIFIVLTELVLGAALIGLMVMIRGDAGIADKTGELIKWSLPLLLFWMLPGALVWLAATLIERRFSIDEGGL